MKLKQLCVFTFLGTFLFTAAVAANLTSDQAMSRYQHFYKSASYQNFIDIISSFDKHDPVFRKRSAPQVFTTMVLENNKDYITNLTQDFKTFSPTLQQYLLAGLKSAGYQAEATRLAKSNKVSSKFNFKLDAQQISTLSISNNDSNLDRLGAAYFATGNPNFLKQFMIYLSQQNDYILKSSYEMNFYQDHCNQVDTSLDQCLKDIVSMTQEDVAKQYPNKISATMDRITTSSQILRILDGLRNTSNTAKNDLAKIAKSNPTLDYVKRLRKLFKNQ